MGVTPRPFTADNWREATGRTRARPRPSRRFARSRKKTGVKAGYISFAPDNVTTETPYRSLGFEATSKRTGPAVVYRLALG